MIESNVQNEKYFLKLFKKRANLLLSVKEHFLRDPIDEESIQAVLKQLATVDSIIKIIENNFTFYKEDK